MAINIKITNTENEINDIIKAHPMISQPAIISDKLLNKIVQNRRTTKLSLPKLSKSNDAVRKGLDLLTKKI